MNPIELIAVMSSALAGPGSQSSPPADPFRASVRLGDVLEGRVLRSLGSGRYAVDFSGFERVVDSAVPFKTDEILYGKVVAIGDRVELQRVRVDAAARLATGAQSLAQVPQAAPALIGDALAPSRGRWSPDEWKAAERLVEDVEGSPAMSLTASAMSRTGLPFSRGVMEFLHALLLRRSGRGLFPTRPEAIRVETAGAEGHADAQVRNPRAVAALADLLRSEFQSSREALRRTEEPGDGRFGEAEAGALLNVQVDGPVSHAVATLPLVVDGRLVELDVALFQQDRKPEDAGKLLHGKIVIALDTDRLGRVGIAATLVGDHVQLSLGSDEAGATEYMARYAAGLRAEVEAEGWHVDEIRYRPGDPEEPRAPARAVLDHMASKNSFSRLV